jgi:hypothetical protein
MGTADVQASTHEICGYFASWPWLPETNITRASGKAHAFARAVNHLIRQGAPQS